MMPQERQAAIKQVVKEFNVPELFLDSSEDVGPDERLYFLHDADKHQFGIWSRDYMGDILFEEEWLRKEKKIEIAKWFKRKDIRKSQDDDDWYKVHINGICYALFLFL